MADEDIGAERPIVTRAAARATGLRFYFTGRPCKHGHVAERYTQSAICVVCRDNYSAGWRDANRDHLHELTRQWRSKNKERRYAIEAAWREKNRLKLRERQKAIQRGYRARHLAETREAARQYQRQHREEQAAYQLKNADRYREIGRRAAHRRRARAVGADGTHTKDDLIRIRKAQKDRCAICRSRLKGGGEIDHIEPLSKGGSNSPTNLQFLCKPCNNSKSARDPLEFMRSLGRLL